MYNFGICYLLVYHCLSYPERYVLSSLAAGPHRGISEETIKWMISQFGQGEIERLDRAQDLGLLEGRIQPDWHGHRYRLRSLIADFLQSTDMFESGRLKFEEYLSSREALRDSSSDIIALALERQLEILVSELPEHRDWLDTLVVEARPEIRTRVYNVITKLKNEQQISLLQEALLAILRTPRPEDITLEIIQLLSNWHTDNSLLGLKRLWLASPLPGN